MSLIKLILLAMVSSVMAEILPPVKLGCAVFAPWSGEDPIGLKVLMGAGLPYTVFTTYDLNAVQLTDDGGRGLYSCLITVDGPGYPTWSQKIRDYQDKFGVRHVIMNSDRFGTAKRVESAADLLKVEPGESTDFLTGIVRLDSNWRRRDFALQVYEDTGIGTYTIPIVKDGAGHTAVFADENTLHIASALNDVQLASLALQHLALQFLLKGHGTDVPLLGHRRILVGMQVDDFFSPPAEHLDRRVDVRTMEWWVDWLADFNIKHGSDVKPELCFNGSGLATKGANDPMYFGKYNFGQQYDYSKAGEKENVYDNLWPDKWWENERFWRPWMVGNDDYAQVANGIRQNLTWKNAFLWLSHTMTHADMGAIGPDDSSVELQYSMEFGNVVLGLDGHPNWSPNGVITGMYSGLMNGDFFVAMDRLGMNNAISDNCEPAHTYTTETREKYQPWYVNEETNGYDADKRIWLVPRFCTACAWDVATFDQNIEAFEYSGTIEDLFEEELDRHGMAMMSLRHEGFMFHQANMVVLDQWEQEQHSLMSLWTEFVVGGVSEYMAIPMVSEPQDRVAELFNLRADYADCSPEVYVQRVIGSSGAPNYIEIKTEGACSIAFEVLDSVPEQTSGPTATVSNEGRYTWIHVTSSGIVTFGTEGEQTPTTTTNPEPTDNDPTDEPTPDPEDPPGPDPEDPPGPDPNAPTETSSTVPSTGTDEEVGFETSNMANGLMPSIGNVMVCCVIALSQLFGRR
eukprot:Clim_evm1s72 gene=Clim_evmTU1s72